jgi:sacsin
LELSKLRDAYPDQLAPFEGLWSYTQALRTTKMRSILRASDKNLTSDEVLRLMEIYFDEARISLLFLRRIKSISFSTPANPDGSWSVNRRPPLDEDEDAKSFSKLVICELKCGTRITGLDKWWVAVEDLLPLADHLPDNSRRVMKMLNAGSPH